MKIEHKRLDRILDLKFKDLKYGSGSTLIVGNSLEYLLIEPKDENILFNDLKNDLPMKKFFKNKPKEVIKSRNDLNRLKFNMKKLISEYSTFEDSLGYIQWYDWAKTIGGKQPDYGYDLAVDLNGNIIVVGYQASYSHGNYDIIVIKFDSWGEIIWQKVIGGADDDRANAIKIDSMNNIYVVGLEKSQSNGNSDCFVFKLNTAGELQWQKAIGGTSGDSSLDLTIGINNDIYVIGGQASSTHGSFDFAIIKMDSSGEIVWQRAIGDELYNIGYAITNDGNNIYISGSSLGSTGNTNANIIKMSSDGSIIWQKQLTSTDETGFIEIAGITYNDSNIFVTGHQNKATFGERDYFLMKLDLDSNIIFSKVFGGSKEEYSYDIKIDVDGYIYLAGKECSNLYGTSGSEFGIIKLDSFGTIIWQRAMGNLSIESARGILPVGKDLYIIGYQKSYSFGSFDIGLIKLKNEQISNMALGTADISFTLTDSTFEIGNPTNMTETITTFTCVDSALRITDWLINNT